MVALLLLALSLGLAFLFTLPIAGAGWALGVQARARVRDGRASGGAGQARAGIVLGIAGVALSAVAMVVWIALLASGFSLEEFRDDLQRELDRQRSTEGAAALALLRGAWRARKGL